MRFRRTIFLLVVFAIFVGSRAWGIPEAPTFSPAPGYYPGGGERMEVRITAPEGCEIYYTLDGSRPVCTNAAGETVWGGTRKKYVGPIEVANGRDSGEGAISRIMTAANEGDAYDPWYAPGEDPRTIPVVRAAAVDCTGGVSVVASASYLLGDMATRYGETPIFSICTEWSDLFATNSVDGAGIYRYPLAPNKTKVKNAHVEFFDQGARQFAKWIELRVQGSSTLTRPKKSLRMTGWKGYNPTKGKKEAFKYPFFEDKANEKYSAIVLRMGGNDWNQGIIRDQVAQGINKHGCVDVQYGSACIVFLNGVYWGVHEIRERWEKGYFKYQQGIEDAFTLLEYGDGENFPLVDQGLGEDDAPRTSAAYLDFWEILRQLEGWGDDVADAERYTWLTNRVNTDSVLQHFGASLFAGNYDWPQNNQRWWRAWPESEEGSVDKSRPRNDGRWNWTFHDMDLAFALPFEYVPGYREGLFAAYDPYTVIFAGEGPYVGAFVEDAARVFHAGMSNTNFHNRYLNYVYLQLSTAWRSDVTAGVLDRAADRFRAAGMDENGLRWRQPQTAVDYEKRVDAIRDYLKARPEAFAWHTRKRYGLGRTRPVVFDTEGGGGIRIAGFGLNSNELPGCVLPQAVYFPQDVPVTVEAVPADGGQFLGWYTTATHLPEEGPAARAEDCAANYGDFPGWSGGFGWGGWVLEGGGTGDAGGYVGTSAMPIHGRSENGNCFGLYAHSGGEVSLRRELAGGGVLGVGETLSLDVGFGVAGGGGGAGVAFITAGDASRPVELILANEGGEGEGYRLYLNGRGHWVENMRHIVGMPIHVALTRTGARDYTLRLIRGGETFATGVEIADEITGVRLYKNSYGDAAEKYNIFLDHLRVAADIFVDEAMDLAAEEMGTTLFYETGAQYARWEEEVVGGNSGSWQNTELLSNIGVPCFGLWANSGARSSLGRDFGFSLGSNYVLSFDFQNNAFQGAGSCAGVEFRTADGVAFRLLGGEGEGDYQIEASGGEAPIDSGAPIVKTGIHVEVVPLASDRLRVVVGGVTNILEVPSAICGLRFFNHDCGAGNVCNVFFNHVWVTKPVDAPDPEPGVGSGEEGVVFHETGADKEKWKLSARRGEKGGWADGGVEDSALLGADTFFLYAGGTDSSDSKPNAAYVRMFPTTFCIGEGYEIGFRFGHGDIGGESEAGIGSVGWNLLDHSGEELCYFAGGRDQENYVYGGEDTGVAKQQDVAHRVRLRFSSATTFDLYLDEEKIVADATVAAAVGGIRFWNWKAGSGPERNLLFNDIVVMAPAGAGTASLGPAAVVRSVSPPRLLSTDRVYSFLPVTNMSILAKFAPGGGGSDLDVWAGERGIADPWVTNGATGLTYVEEYLRETNGIAVLHSGGTGRYVLHFQPGEHGIGAEMEVSESLRDGIWRQPVADELRVTAEGGIYDVTPTNDAGQLYIRLKLRPLE